MIDNTDIWDSFKVFFDIEFQNHVLDYRVNGTELKFNITQFRSTFEYGYPPQ